MNSRSHNNSFDDCGLPIFLNPLCSYEAYNVIFLSFFQVCSFFHNEVSPDREHRYIFFPCNVTSISSNLLFNQFNLINNLQSWDDAQHVVQQHTRSLLHKPKGTMEEERG